MVKNEQGFTLVELLVAVGITSIIIIGALYVFLNQMRHAHTGRRMAIAQSELQLGEGLIRRDIFMAGFGLESNLRGIISGNRTNAPDSIVLLGNAYDLSLGMGRWSFVMEEAQNSNNVTVRDWGDEGFNEGDHVIFLNDDKNLIAGPVIVNGVSETTGPDLDGDGVPDPALTLSLSENVSLARGVLVYVCPTDGSVASSITYKVDSLVLYRNDAPFLEPVEDMQIAYGLDSDNDGEVDSWVNDVNDLPVNTLRRELKLVRLNILIRTGKYDPHYTYSENQIVLEDRTIQVDSLGKHYRRAVLRSLTIPRNLR